MYGAAPLTVGVKVVTSLSKEPEAVVVQVNEYGSPPVSAVADKVTLGAGQEIESGTTADNIGLSKSSDTTIVSVFKQPLAKSVICKS